jgi:hypothetical protein
MISKNHKLIFREFNQKILKNQKKGFFERVFKEMKHRLKDLITNRVEIELLEKLESDSLNTKPKVCVYRGLYLFTQVEVRVTRLDALDLNELVD